MSRPAERAADIIEVQAEASTFLDYLADQGQRSWSAQQFYRAARTEAVASAGELVRRTRIQVLRRQLESTDPDPPDARRCGLLLRCIREHPAEALDFALKVLELEAMPVAERRKLKAQRALRYAMADKPATEKQIRYLARLGYDGEVRDRVHASELIDELAGAR